MAKLRKSKQLTQPIRNLVLCEGQTEQWYLTQQLDSKMYKVEKSKYSNALQLVSLEAYKKAEVRDWNKIYCVFDRDAKSNMKEQLQTINKIFNEPNSKLERVVSNPCFEIALWFNYVKNTKVFMNCDEVKTTLNQKLPDDKQYNKTKSGIKHICEFTDFNNICNTALVIYDELAINDDNWLEITDGFSEIFKLNSV